MTYVRTAGTYLGTSCGTVNDGVVSLQYYSSNRGNLVYLWLSTVVYSGFEVQGKDFTKIHPV